MADLISQYGYLAVLIGCFTEGETTLVLGAIAAKLGYLDIGLVILCAFFGTFLGDNLFFFLGRWYGDGPMRKSAKWRLRARAVNRLLTKYDTWFIFGFRFIYGIRSVCPFVFGASGVSPRRFMLLDAAAAAVWAAAIGGASFALGSAVELFIARMKGAAVIAGGLALWAIYLLRVRMRAKQYLAATAENGEPEKAGTRSR
jgi:membrane protein DedA with SNARE-associated domain